ncbi:hypothetical protein B0H19DRAFT_1109158 [Mycena capillaripes]|nr:hypothetical protein B0H19DRAFT_1109158 [Mycena capillaripes]
MPTRLASSYRNREPRDTHSRNPGRRDGFRWNAAAFICPASVDGFPPDLRDPAAATMFEDNADREDVWEPEPCARPTSRHEVALMDIARYAKLKGVAKEFEVLDAPRRVIVLDEDAFWDEPQFLDDDSEWEDVRGFADFDSETGTSSQGPDADYLLARRLQDEEDALRVRDPGISGTGRRAYADVLAEANG